MAEAKSLLILTEAGEGIGFGHFSRCCAIRDFFRRMNNRCEVIVDAKGDSSHFDSKIENWLVGMDDVNKDRLFSHVLVDSYLAPVQIFDTLKRFFVKVVAIDDYHRVSSGPDLIINPNIYGRQFNYISPAVGGKDFVILREVFTQDARRYQVSDRQKIDVFLTVGGSDTRGILPELTRILLSSDSVNRIVVACGTDSYAEKLRARFRDPSISFLGFLDGAHMKDAMLNCDAALTACGQSLHEFTWLGVPLIGVCIAHDQVHNMREYLRSNILPFELHWDAKDLRDKILSETSRLSFPAERRRRALLARGILTAEGLQNIYKAILN